MIKRDKSEECIVDSKQSTYSKYSTAFIDDVNAEDDESPLVGG